MVHLCTSFGSFHFPRLLALVHSLENLGACTNSTGKQLFDAQLACLFGLPAQYAMTDIQVPLPVPAPPDSPDSGIPFGQVMACLLDRGQLLEQPSDMGLSCIAYALYRYLSVSSCQVNGGRTSQMGIIFG